MNLGIWLRRDADPDGLSPIGTIVLVRELTQAQFDLKACFTPRLCIVCLASAPDDAYARLDVPLTGTWEDTSDPNTPVILGKTEMTVLWSSLRPPLRRQLEDPPHYLEVLWADVADVPLRNRRLGIDTSLQEIYDAAPPP